MQPTGRQQLFGQAGEAAHARITMVPARGLRDAGHAKLRFHQCLPLINRPLTDMISGSRLLEPRWRLMVKSSLSAYRRTGTLDRAGIGAGPYL
jgi:hypothetical protein